MEESISEMFKHIFLRIPDEVCVFFIHVSPYNVTISFMMISVLL
ncbi:hypothetical protein CIRMBP1196_02001 [Enterococcus cecorum]|nr:hypothetical protein CIRMBP1212_00499 [Enterococcus cecorum]CAI3348485.1 hypothetical protein CIRMBP1238_01089 [Enterococcus cecorum]CAI3352187.1 hypothetical protein CIRMBP1302_00523 [Enterococcus cecorum]CAI3361409.1 hypothetical protein CIRMBP1234_01101 [Enterococcus cecorum]CAI3361713.1 hypothetical protein CIRMBP1207_01286 [Enterococcus cecorum]